MVGKADIRAGRAFVELFVKGAKWEAGLKSASAQLKAVGESAKKIGQQLATMGVATGAVVAASVKRFAEFDDQMRAVGAVSQSTDAELAILTETAKKLGATTSFTAVQVASLMTELGRAGFTASEVDKMTGAVLSLARATGTDATLSSGIMSATIRQFGLDASQAGRVADAFTVAANKSFNTVEQLGEALNYAGPVANDFNMTLEETLAIFGGLGNMGIQASNAGTAVRRLLTITGSEAEKLQEIFGVTFSDAAGNARPLIDVLEEVNQATRNLGTSARSSKFNEAFGLLGITAASALGSTAVSVKALKAELDKASGVSEITAAKMDAGLGGAFRILLSAVEGVAISLGNALAPVLQKIAAQIIDISGRVKAWIDNNRELATFLTGSVAAATALGFSLLAIGGSVVVLSTAFGGLATLIGMATTAFTALVSPIGLVVTALVAFEAAWLHATGIIPQITEALKPVIPAIRAIAVALGGGEFSRAWEIASTAIQYMGSVAKDVFYQLPDVAAFAAGKVARAFVDAFKATWTFIVSTTEALFTGLLDAAGEFSRNLAISMAVGGVVGTFGKALENVAGEISDLAIRFDAGFQNMTMWAPKLEASGATKDLRDALNVMMEITKEGKAAAAAASAAAASVGLFASAPGALGTTGGSATAGGGTPKAPGTKPEIDLAAIDKYKQRIDELKAARKADTITQAEYDAGVKQLRRDLLGISDPLQDYRDRLELLSEAVKRGTISQAEFEREAAAAKAELVDQTPIEQYMARLKELKALFDAGIINRQQFESAQMDALPDKVKSIIERSKTPLERFNEQITEARDFFSKGLITEGQFAKEQERLQKELREEEKKGRKSGEVSVSFSAAALIAQGRGAQGGRDVLGSKMDEQISATNTQTDVLKKIEEKIGKNRAVFS